MDLSNEKEFQHLNLVCKLNNKYSSGNLGSVDAFILVSCTLGACSWSVLQYTQISVKHETKKTPEELNLQNKEYFLCCLHRKIFPCVSWPKWDSCRIWPSRATVVCAMALLGLSAAVQADKRSWGIRERKMLMKDTTFTYMWILLGCHWPLFCSKT